MFSLQHHELQVLNLFLRFFKQPCQINNLLSQFLDLQKTDFCYILYIKTSAMANRARTTQDSIGYVFRDGDRGEGWQMCVEIGILALFFAPMEV